MTKEEAIKMLTAKAECMTRDTIGYSDCGFALLKMWMDDVLSDGEYSYIMAKLNKHWGKKDGD